MRRFFYNKNSILLASALLLTACQPPSDNSQSAIANTESTSDEADADLSFVIDGGTVTLSSDSILSIKPSRYQPSLGLKGQIKPIQQSRFVTAKDVTVQKVLVKQGQWVEKGTPLFILQHEPLSADDTDSENQKKAALNQQATNSVSANASSTLDQLTDDHKPADTNKAQPEANKEVKAANNNANTDPKSNSKNNIDANKANLAEDATSPISSQSTEQSPTSKPNLASITVRASFSGRVQQLPIANDEQVKADHLLLYLADDSHLQFIATLPIKAEPQLSVGQSVNFTTEDNANKYTGQVSKLSVASNPSELQVHVQVLKNEASREKQLKPNMMVSGRVDYGQIAVGTVVPKSAIHDADLRALQNPPYQPLAPLTANVWIIKQDQRLTRQPVEVIEYDPITEQYLIAGINNDSLICLADLPIESAGKKVVIS